MHDFHSTQPVSCFKSSEDDVHAAEVALTLRRPAELPSHFTAQFITPIVLEIRKKRKKLPAVKQPTPMLRVRKTHQQKTFLSSFPDVCSACMLFLTIPVILSTSE